MKTAKPTVFRDAIFSADQKFRYTLTRTWANAPRLLVVMMNPSVADARKDDPTITRVMTRAMRGGYGGLIVCNLYAYRSPFPRDLAAQYKQGNEVIGRENDNAIFAAASLCQAAFVAWGNHQMCARRDGRVLVNLYERFGLLLCLGLTGDGFPRHPLHVAYSVPFQPYKGRFAK